MHRVAVCLFFALLLGGCYNEADELQRLAQHNQVADATIVYLDCGNHGAVVYSFSMSGREFRGKASNGELNCRKLKRGDVVRVYYDPQKPQVNTAVRPMEAYEHARGWYLPDWLFIALELVGLAAVPLGHAIHAAKRSTRQGG